MAKVTQTPANVRAGSGAITQLEEAGEAFSAGQGVYLNSTNGKYYKCDADDSDKIGIKGLALTGSDGDESRFVVQIGGECNIGGTTAQGTIYVIGDDGDIYPSSDASSGWYPVILGIAVDNSGTLELVCQNGSVAKA